MSDEFEDKNMRDGASVVHRDKKVSRGMALLLSGAGVFVWVLAAVIGFGNATAPKPVPATALPFVMAAMAALGLMFVVMGVMFGVVRTLVTAREVNVKYGLWGPRIPLSKIRACNVIEYDWTKYGGWGIRRGADGSWAYVPGNGRVLELLYEEGGKEKRVLVGAENADETARQIQRLRVAAGSPAGEASHLRVDAPEEVPAEEAESAGAEKKSRAS